MISFKSILLEQVNTTGSDDILTRFTPDSEDRRDREKKEKLYNKYGGKDGRPNSFLNDIEAKTLNGAYTYQSFMKKVGEWAKKYGPNPKAGLEYVFNVFFYLRRLRVNSKYTSENDKPVQQAPVQNSNKQKEKKQDLGSFLHSFNEKNPSFNIEVTDSFEKKSLKIADYSTKERLVPDLKRFANEAKGLNPKELLKNQTFYKTYPFRGLYGSNIIDIPVLRNRRQTKEYPKITGALYKATLQTREKNKDLLVFVDFLKSKTLPKRHIVFLDLIHHDEYWDDKNGKASDKELEKIKRKAENLAQNFYNQFLSSSSIKNITNRNRKRAINFGENNPEKFKEKIKLDDQKLKNIIKRNKLEESNEKFDQNKTTIKSFSTFLAEVKK